MRKTERVCGKTVIQIWISKPRELKNYNYGDAGTVGFMGKFGCRRRSRARAVMSTHVALRVNVHRQNALEATVPWFVSQGFVGASLVCGGSTSMTPCSSWSGHGAHEVHHKSPTPAIPDQESVSARTQPQEDKAVREGRRNRT